MSVDELDIRLLRSVQDGLKLTKRPYQDLGDEMGMSEDEVIQRLGRLWKRELSGGLPRPSAIGPWG